MADNEEVWSARYDTSHVQASATAAAQTVEKLEAKLDRMVDASGRVQDSLGRFVSTTEGAAKSVEKLDRAVAHYNVVADQGARAGASFGSAFGSAGAGRSVLEFSRAVEDAQYGIHGVLNNIPTLVVAMGGGAGLAGVISLVAVGAGQLYRNWDNLTGLFRDPATEDEATRMERLANSTHRTAEETKELNKHKREQAELEKILSTPSATTAEAQRGFQAGVGQAGGSELQGALEKGLEAQQVRLGGGVGPTPPATARREQVSAEASGVAKFFRAARDFLGIKPSPEAERLQKFVTGSGEPALPPGDLEKSRQEARKKQVEDLVKRAAAGDITARGQIQGLIEELPPGQRPPVDFLNPPLKPGEAPPPPLAPGQTIADRDDQVRRAKEQRQDEERAASKASEDRRRAAEKAAEDEEREAERAAGERAKSLAAGPLGRQLLGGKSLGDAEVGDALKAAGVEATGEEAGAARDKLEEEIARQVRERAINKGISPDLASKQLFNERAQEDEDEAKRDAEKARREKDKALKEGVDAAKDEGGDILARFAASAGGTPAQIARLLQQRQGLSADVAGSLAGDAVKAQRRSDLAEQLQGEKARPVDVLSSATFADVLQKAVGGPGDVAEKQLAEQRLTNEKLQQILQRNPGLLGGDVLR
jgi:hypothetical protein